MRSASVFRPADEQVGGHRVERRARDLAEVEHLRHQLRIAHDDAAQGIGVAAQELRGAVDHEISPQIERPLVDGRREGVVDDDDRPCGVARGRQSCDVEHLEGGVRGRLEIEEPSALGDGALESRVVARIAQVDLDADPWQELQEDAVRAAVRVAHGHDAIAGPQQCEQRVGDGGHARGEARGRRAPLKDAHLLLEGVNGRVRVAAVDVAGLAAQGHRQPLVDVCVSIGRAVDDGHLGRPIERALALSGPHRERGR